MKHQFRFDNKTGTMVPANGITEPDVKAKKQGDIKVGQSDEATVIPDFQEKKHIITKDNTVTIQNQVVKMQRVDKPTPVQLVTSEGLPEAYLDCVSTGIMMFRERQDYDICQITDEKTGKTLAYIGGYALAFNFNMAELSNMERIEQCLEGLKKLFRHKIMTQNLGQSKPEK